MFARESKNIRYILQIGKKNDIILRNFASLNEEIGIKNVKCKLLRGVEF